MSDTSIDGVTDLIVPASKPKGADVDADDTSTSRQQYNVLVVACESESERRNYDV